MFLHIPHLIKKTNKNQNTILTFAGGFAIAKIATALFYLTLPIILSSEYNIGIAGIIIGAANALSMIVSPMSGIISDKKGTLVSLRLYVLCFMVGGLAWLIGKNGPITWGLICFFCFLAYGFEIREPYVLKHSKHKEGGKMFGLTYSILGIGYFCGTMLLPFFTNNYYPRVPLIMIVNMAILLLVTYVVPQEKKKKQKTYERKKELKETLKLHKHIKTGIEFIKKNKGYPIFSLSESLFDGIYFAGVRFLIPLIITGEGFIDGLPLGIYEFTSIFLGGFCGYIADKKGRQGVNIAGRSLVIIGCLMMIFTQETSSLIIIGTLVGIGNTLFYGASMHALEEHDTHHHADGRFSTFKRLLLNAGYVIIPLLMGRLYHSFNFQTAITTLMIITIALATTMIVLTVRKK